MKKLHIFCVIIILSSIVFFAMSNIPNEATASDAIFIKDESSRMLFIDEQVKKSIGTKNYPSALIDRAELNLNLMHFKDTEYDLIELMDIFKKNPCKTKEECDIYLNSISLLGNLHYELDINSKDKSRQDFYYKNLLKESKRLKFKDHEINAKIFIDSEEFKNKSALAQELIDYLRLNDPDSFALAANLTIAAANAIKENQYIEAKKLINESDIIMAKKAPPWDGFRIMNQILKVSIDYSAMEDQSIIDKLKQVLEVAQSSPKLNHKNIFDINLLIADAYRNIGNTRKSSQYFKKSFDLISSQSIIPNDDFIDVGFRYLYSLIEDNSLGHAKAIVDQIVKFSDLNDLIEVYPSTLIPIYYYSSHFLAEEGSFNKALSHLSKIIIFQDSNRIEDVTHEYIEKSKTLLKEIRDKLNA